MDKFYALLRFSVHAEDVVPQIEDKDWGLIFTLAQRHSLLGVIFYGILKSGLKPPQHYIFQFFSYCEKIKVYNRKTNDVAIEVTRLFEQNGFRSCILKGQGNSLNYPDPYSRSSGDVDIWLEGGKEQIVKFINSQWPGQLERYHHVEIPPIKGVPIEVHFMPAYMRNPLYNRRLQKWFAEQAEEQFSHAVMLPDSEKYIYIPTPEFNCVYQLQHMFSHLLTEGFGLRHVTDYYFVLVQYTGEKEKIQKVLKYLGLWKFAGAMMWVMQRVYNLDSKYLIASPNQKEGEFLLSEILHSGNMGYYDTRLGHKEGESLVHRYFRMTLRNMRFVMHYPAETLFEPLFRTWHFFWRLAHK